MRVQKGSATLHVSHDGPVRFHLKIHSPGGTSIRVAASLYGYRVAEMRPNYLGRDISTRELGPPACVGVRRGDHVHDSVAV